MRAVKNKVKSNYELKGDISFNIRRYRKAKHLTQEELAESADISYDFMRRIETSKGTCGFSIYTIYKISLALGVSISDLIVTNEEVKEKVSESDL